jgi:hypothetical protein
MAAPTVVNPATSPTTRNPVQLPNDWDFKRSYERFNEYPENLVFKTSYPGALKDSIIRFDEQAPKVFRKDRFTIPFRDFIDTGN